MHYQNEFSTSPKAANKKKPAKGSKPNTVIKQHGNSKSHDTDKNRVSFLSDSTAGARSRSISADVFAGSDNGGDTIGALPNIPHLHRGSTGGLAASTNFGTLRNSGKLPPKHTPFNQPRHSGRMPTLPAEGEAEVESENAAIGSSEKSVESVGSAKSNVDNDDANDDDSDELPSPHQHHADAFIASLNTNHRIPLLPSKTHSRHNSHTFQVHSSSKSSLNESRPMDQSLFVPTLKEEVKADEPSSGVAAPACENSSLQVNVIREEDEQEDDNSLKNADEIGETGEDNSVSSSIESNFHISDVVGYVDAIGFHSGKINPNKSEAAKARLSTVDALGNIIPGEFSSTRSSSPGSVRDSKPSSRRSTERSGLVRELDSREDREMAASGKSSFHDVDYQYRTGDFNSDQLHRSANRSPLSSVEINYDTKSKRATQFISRGRSISCDDDLLKNHTRSTTSKDDKTAVQMNPTGTWKPIPSNACEDPENRLPTPLLDMLSEVVKKTVEGRKVCDIFLILLCLYFHIIFAFKMF